ncbi:MULTISPECIES: MFS transporter [unclassified Clostridioides]|uniref:MFS transporter n=1 Tax=unclassified Clostridioides TaxID=2635829 RepID=UPI0006BBEFB3|nr:MFS transporter [Clostridioides sp. ZZV14-6387]MCI9975080.1 MFS transporter [Clostridioides difficile]MDB3085300.1 MFS transporter [Clostridioides difficile]MDI0266711.1 MFS transporter [Clostridioides difficile]MDI7816853.1 MFS transporter [Clostridioides difficile]
MEKVDNNKKYIILGILFIAWFVGYCDKMAINVAAIPISKEYGLNPTQVGFLISSFSFGMAIMSLFGGYFADKYESKKLIIVIVSIWAIFSTLTGMSWSFVSLMVIRFMYGCAEGIFPPASSVTIAENFKKEQFGRAKSFLISAGQLGTAFAGLIIAYLAFSYGWRKAFFIFAIADLIIALSLYLLNKNEKNTGKSTQKTKSKKVPLKEAFKNPIVWKTPIIQFGVGFLMWGLNSWLPQYWVNVKHLDIKTMATYSMIPALASFVFVNISGWIIDKYFVGREKIAIIASLIIMCISVFLMYNTGSIVLGFIYQTIANLGVCCLSPAFYTLVLKYVRKDLVGTATGFIAFGSSVAGIIAPLIMGLSITLLKGSYIAVFGMIIVILILCIFLAATINTREQAEKNMNEQNL